MMGRIAARGVWQEFRERSAHGSRRRREVKWALRDVSFNVESGECVVIMGHNGSGKTTLLKTAAGVLSPTRGACDISGRVGSLIDLSPGVNGRELTGWENIKVNGVLLGLSRSEIRARYDRIRELSGLSDTVFDRPISTYSSGMILRISFAMLVATEPSVLVADEVLAAGDDEFRTATFKYFEESKAAGAAILLASHDLDFARSVADRVVVLNKGELVTEGPPLKAIDRYLLLESPKPSPIFAV